MARTSERWTARGMRSADHAGGPFNAMDRNISRRWNRTAGSLVALAFLGAAPLGAQPIATAPAAAPAETAKDPLGR
jgi:hypothetical protein